MPTYQYECAACNHQFEIFQSMMDNRLKKCPKCGRMKLDRLIGTGSGIIFRGSGFYETDYKQKVSCPRNIKKDDKKDQSDKDKSSNSDKPGCCPHASSCACPS